MFEHIPVTRGGESRGRGRRAGEASAVPEDARARRVVGWVFQCQGSATGQLYPPQTLEAKRFSLAEHVLNYKNALPAISPYSSGEKLRLSK